VEDGFTQAEEKEDGREMGECQTPDDVQRVFSLH
jgi:hypothetical protein